MKSEKKNLLGFDVTITNIVETLGEAVIAAGSEDAVLKDYVSNVLAHSHYTIARRAIIKKLVELTGIKQKTKGGTGKDKEEIIEKDAVVARITEEVGEEILKSYNDEIDKAVGDIKVDYTPGTRGSGGSSTPAKKWLAYYDQMVSEEKLDLFCQKHDIAQDGVDEETVKFAVANKVREIVIAKMEAAAQAAMEV